MKSHPAAELFPMLEGEAFDSLVASIKENGQVHPIVTIKGAVLDGRNRLAACEAAGVEPKFVEYKGKDPLGYVVGVNLIRRHLDASQRAMMGARLRPLFEAAAQERETGGTLASKEARGRSSAKAAEVVHVSKSGVERAVKVLADGAAATIKAVDAGDISVSRAALIADLPKAEQPAAVKEAIEGAPADYSEADHDADRMADLLADYESMSKVMASDDRLKAAMEEVRLAKHASDTASALYDDKSRELAIITREAKRWMKKANKSAACEACKEALGAE